MRKAKTILLFSVLVAASLLFSACTQSASNGEVTPQDDSQLQEILDAVANQTPAPTTATDDGTGGNPSADEGLAQTQTAQAAVPTPAIPEATATPSPTPTIAVVEVDLVVPTSYTLHKGEFPWCLARRFDVDATSLVNANGGAMVQYDPGDVLTIPTGAAKFQGTRALVKHPATYTVKSGDTFYSIACDFGDVWPEQIAAQNGLTLEAALSAGTTLNIP